MVPTLAVALLLTVLVWLRCGPWAALASLATAALGYCSPLQPDCGPESLSLAGLALLLQFLGGYRSLLGLALLRSLAVSPFLTSTMVLAYWIGHRLSPAWEQHQSFERSLRRHRRPWRPERGQVATWALLGALAGLPGALLAAWAGCYGSALGFLGLGGALALGFGLRRRRGVLFLLGWAMAGTLALCLGAETWSAAGCPASSAPLLVGVGLACLHYGFQRSLLRLMFFCLLGLDPWLSLLALCLWLWGRQCR